MKVKELIEKLSKLDPDIECVTLDSDAQWCKIVDAWSEFNDPMSESDTKDFAYIELCSLENNDIQLGEKNKESSHTSRGVWHYLPETPNTSCYCMVRMKDREFVKDATYIKNEYSSNFIITYYDTGLQKYDTRTLRDDEIECWCGLEELADLLDGKI